MRIHLSITPSEEKIPFNYQPMLTGALHKWLGQNDIHSGLSLYSFSWLKGGRPYKSGLQFTKGGRFFISAYDNELLKKIIQGIQNDPAINEKLAVREVLIQETPEFEKGEARFYCASPVLVKRRIHEKEEHFTYDNPQTNRYLTETLKNKLIKAGLESNNIIVEFDKSYHSPKTKVIYYNKIGNRVNICPVKIKGTPEQLAFAWNVGVGNSTGIGFGSLK